METKECRVLVGGIPQTSRKVGIFITTDRLPSSSIFHSHQRNTSVQPIIAQLPNPSYNVWKSPVGNVHVGAPLPQTLLSIVSNRPRSVPTTQTCRLRIMMTRTYGGFHAAVPSLTGKFLKTPVGAFSYLQELANSVRYLLEYVDACKCLPAPRGVSRCREVFVGI